MATEKMMEARDAKQYAQQVALLKMQADISEAAGTAQREELAKNKRRDRALDSILNFREGEDIEEFLLTAEVPEREWVTAVSSKLNGEMGSSWQKLSVTVDGYQAVKMSLLKEWGHTPKLAGEMFYGFRQEDTGGLTADQLFRRGVQLIRRMVAPHLLGEEVEFALVRPWVCAAVSRKAREVINGRAVSSSEELIDALRDHLLADGDRTASRAAVFGKQSHGSDGNVENKVGIVKCFACGKVGHKSFECRQVKDSSVSSSFYQPAAEFGSTPSKITCYACGEEGHKSNMCPNRNGNGKAEPNLIKNIKAEPKEVPVKPIRRIRKSHPTDSCLSMMVNSQEASVLLDSGSSITVVPESMVAQGQRTGDTVAVRAFGAKTDLLLHMAEVPFEVGTLKWVEPVALAPVEEGCVQ